ncbi:DsbA family protein [Streptomyces aurantiacus]|uniref:DsbA family protein n=1 Tax=Streptomyces aurantiacus TaxID=47760 RepID=UPI000AB0D4FD|nr:thioredoxin domain-containing protein [Streptomyces aurantiacus]
MVRGGRWAVLCVAMLTLAGCGQAEYGAGSGAGSGAGFESAQELPEKLGKDGTTILVGDPDARVTVRLYEDLRCPVCEEFETTGGARALRKAMIDGQVKTEYTLASFLDDRVGGSGSKKAANALRAALGEGKFVEYHEVLFANQPEESVDGYTTANLLELADEVEGLRGPAFDTAVKTMKYRTFVTASEKAYERAGGAEEPEGPGTPTAVINGKRITVEYYGMLFDNKIFDALLQQIYDTPGSWKNTRL